MNHYLPDDICVLELKTASDRFHSRYNAVGKTYRYTCYVGSEKPVFDRKYVYAPEEKPDVEKLNRESRRGFAGESRGSFAAFPCATLPSAGGSSQKRDLDPH